MNIDFNARRIAVVGAAQGIGRAIALAFAARGAYVWACDLAVARVQAYIDEADSLSGIIVALRVDVTSESSVEELFTALQQEGDVDALIYVAGGMCGQIPQPIEEVLAGQWRQIEDVNLFGAFLSVRAVAAGMKARKAGRIIIVSSRAGLATSLTGIQSYCAAKHGQTGLVKQLAQEFAPSGVTVNAVAPGFMKTNPDAQRQWDGYTPEFQRGFSAQLVAGRLGEPEDIAHAVMFLASDYAGWITGQTLPVTGMPLV
ncbi:SDR family NAD(P)-dependent oxidoreductase [Salinicola peritrichatus]|uniref:SDR family NAD(P)-dependent oxidoreductase n=1 Tax=Salinicola peritrichatus TaxID=1267424 RepID=UPI000DA1F5FF|nr:SDR family NAD(P)-dependent oxidoreductase [Salinicola peritrichatus]